MKKHKITYFFPYTLEEAKSEFSNCIDFSTVKLIRISQETLRSELYETVEDCTVIIGDFTHKIPITRDIIISAKNLKLIQLISVAYDDIDVETATECKVPVANIAGFNASSVAEHGIMFMLETMI